MATPASQSYEIPPSPSENREALPKEPAGKVDLTVASELKDQREVDSRKADLNRIIREILVQETLDDDAFTQITVLTGMPISPEDQIALKAAPRARRAALFLKVTELQESDRKTLKNWEDAGTPMTEAQYRREKALLVRLGEGSFNKKTKTLLDSVRWNNRAGEEVTNDLLIEGDEGMGMDESWTFAEKKEWRAALTQAREEYAYVNKISENPEAQAELYDRLQEKASGALSEENFIKEAAKIEEKYELTPAVAAEKMTQEVAKTKTEEETYAEQLTKKEEKAVLTTLGLQEDKTVQVLGLDRGGNVVLQMGETGNVHCGYNREAETLNWIKIDINGHEYEKEPREAVNAGSFHKEVSLAKVGGIVDYYRLPFDQPEQDKFIEILLTETGDVSAEFTYDQYTDAMGQQMIAFLEMLTPDGDKGTTQAIFKKLGITRDGVLNPDRLRAVASTWAGEKATYKPEEILDQLQGGGNESAIS